MLGVLLDKIIELGIDAGLECCSSLAHDMDFDHTYKKTVENSLRRYWDRFNISSQDEEFDYQGLCDYMRHPDLLPRVKGAISGTQAERSQARNSIYQAAFHYTNATSSEARKQIRRIVNGVLETLRALERNKVPLETSVALAATVDEINEHSDNNKKEICEEIRKIGELLQASESKSSVKQYANMYTAILDNGGRRLENGGVLFNIDVLNRQILGFADEKELQFMRDQLGDRISGNENREEIITLFWAEAKMTFQSGKRFEVMPFFQNVVRDACTASIYTDGVPRVVDRIQMARYYWEEYDIFHLQGDLYILRILLYNNLPAAITMSYNFGNLPDVNDRLYYFEKINPIVEAHSIQITGHGVEDYNIKLDMENLEQDWQDHIELTRFWISQMNNISTIESYYKVHFDLPAKASEEEYIAIDILSDSISRLCCRTLPGLSQESLEGADTDTVIIFDEEMSIGCPDCLMDVDLFGYTFEPIDEYIIPCELQWHEENQCFETQEGGIPTGVDFRLSPVHPVG